jgi:VIT1/CCC1 family predicted Fe2+/Mn2+ transporter
LAAITNSTSIHHGCGRIPAGAGTPDFVAFGGGVPPPAVAVPSVLRLAMAARCRGRRGAASSEADPSAFRSISVVRMFASSSRKASDEMRHKEVHRSERIGWLRAAVLGANDGIVSTASLILGVAGSGAEETQVVVAGIAGLVAGSMSMAAGEYVSVQSQADTEEADLSRERKELASSDASERAELAGIYVSRGLDPALAQQVADQLMAHDALGAHARDELGITDIQRARPVVAALSSAGTFAVGASLPLGIAFLSPAPALPIAVVSTSLACLAGLGALAARVGGARAAVGAVRVTFWGAFAMALTYGVGALFGTVV